MKEHQELVRRLKKPASNILDSMCSVTMDCLHMVTKLQSESGELADAIGKKAFYNKPLDMENVIEELGDIEFYLEGLRQAIGVTREQTLAANIAKLTVRYGVTYSDEAAQARKDKAAGNGDMALVRDTTAV